MEIDANMNWGSVNGLTPSKRSAAAAGPNGTPAATDSFSNSNTLENLQNTPDVRADAVARGRALVGQDGYPPADTLKKLSSFLASKLPNSGSVE